MENFKVFRMFPFNVSGVVIMTFIPCYQGAVDYTIISHINFILKGGK